MARAKNLKKNQDQQKRNDDGLTPGQRKERYGKETNEYPENIINGFSYFRDAAALKEKIKMKEEEKQAAASK